METFEAVVKPRLEAILKDIRDPLLDTQRSRVVSWIEVYLESDHSLNQRSRARKCVRRRARYFVRKAYSLGGSGLLLLCSLAWSISALPSIPSTVYGHLSDWWMCEDRTTLSGIAEKACEGLLPQQPKQKHLENESPIQNTAVGHQTASPIAATESPGRFSPLPESESTRG